jgi:hypothetical protein
MGVRESILQKEREELQGRGQVEIGIARLAQALCEP